MTIPPSVLPALDIRYAERLLTPRVWQTVMAAIPHGPDPLFGEAPDARYRELRRQIALEAKEI